MAKGFREGEMQRFSDHALRRAEPSPACFAALVVVATLLVLAAFPTFASAATQTLTVEKAGTGTGAVTSSPAGINCGATCSAPFAEGSTVVLKALSGPNTAVVEWTGCTAGETLEHECKVTMSTAKTVTATFNLIELPLKVTKNGAGAGAVTSLPAGIECGATCSASFVKGTTVTLTGTPGPNTLAPSWSGCDGFNAEGKCVVTMSTAKKVIVTFGLPEDPLTVKKAGAGAGTVTSSPAGINCGAACSASFVNGATVTLTATPGLHTQQLVQWSGCESSSGNTCEVTMSAARSVTATFALERQYVEYPVSIRAKGTGKGTVTSSPSGIGCPEDCSQSYLFNTHLTLSASAASGSVFDHWSVPACASSPTCTVTVKGSRKIAAVFTAVGNRPLTVAKAGSGHGTVTSKPAAIECGATCSAQIDASTKVALKAKPDKGSKFTGWSGEGCEGKRVCRLRMNEARNVTATFAKVAPPTAPGTLVVISAKAKGGKAMVRVFCSGGSACDGTLTLIARIHNAQGQVKGLVIAKIPYTLATGASSTLKAKLGSRVLALLRSQGRLKLRATGSGVAGRTLKLAQ